MNGAIGEETMVSTELWLSFVSLLRAYAAAAGVNGGEPAVVEAAEHSITMTAGSVRFNMQVDPRTGAGNWQMKSGGKVTMRGTFALLPEGRIALDGKTLDLDHAAIDFVAFLMNAAARNER